MSIPLNNLDRADDGHGYERGKPSFEYDQESTSTEVEEQEPFISLSKQNTPTLESQETSVEEPTMRSSLMKLGKGMGTFIGYVLILGLFAAAVLTTVFAFMRLVVALWQKIGLIPS
ncbi:hypothetical protein F4813DRAFT_359354 [Daldinia decipiens]|uniref:uncharacterized protein n=1 Tax=Daldinia decipiens TaxID=326647 RepID=UPI0020C2ABE4|nr:uncharacterized protein F4813DRAFT_359354 [Daldinia decipiens]KAI1657722.1 hypothetical protein F4813DRAFT_359354 [Daldinia decipiens]